MTSTEQVPLTADDRSLLEAIGSAAFANPFSPDRQALDERIGGLGTGTPPEKSLAAMLARVRTFVERLDGGGQQQLRAFAPEDREPMLLAYLLDIFHRHIEAFDRLIDTQLRAGDEPTPAPVAARALADIASRGVPDADALRYVAMFFQLRRAYYFIDRMLVGRSPSMQALRMALWNSVFTRDMRLYQRHLWNRMEDFSTLLVGETGTGKGAAAAAVGRSGFIPFDPRRGCFQESFVRTFLAINLSQFPATLLESELFGHRKGAFTGAVEAHAGVFARCSPCGAIFLDEIGELGAPVQIKLLQVLQERAFTPVGSHERRRFQGRVIAATNRAPDDLLADGRFRVDFYYRLCSDVIAVPPLRQRLRETPAELDDLVDVTLTRTVGAPTPELGRWVRDTIRARLGPDYDWPGNVRELEQCVRRILLTHGCAPGPRPAGRDPAATLAHGLEAGRYTADELLAAYCRLLHRRHGTYEEVARRTGLDRRTARKYVLQAGDRVASEGPFC